MCTVKKDREYKIQYKYNYANVGLYLTDPTCA